MKKKGLHFLANLDLYIASGAFIILVFITFFGVIMRYAFSKPYVWQEELQVALFLWVILFGGSVAFRSHAHIEVDMLYDKFSLRVQKVLSYCIVCLVVFVLFYFNLKGLKMIELFVRTHKSTPVLNISSALIYSAVPLCSLLMIGNFLYDFLKTTRCKKTLEEK